MRDTTAVQTTTIPTACAWIHSCLPIPTSPTDAVTQSTTAPGPPKLRALNTPVSRAPRMPPKPWTPNTTSESSAPMSFLRPVQPQRHTTPAARPITNAPGIPTLPAAGVIATRPATAPEAAPSIDGLPLSSHSANVHESTAHAVARNVFMNARAAKPFASSAEPALNPNQPNHSIDAPIIVIVKLCGGMLSRPKPTRLPSTTAPIKPATPALIWTTVPPAKSSAPQPQIKPACAFAAAADAASVYASGPAQNQTMCATGMYANVNQITR